MPAYDRLTLSTPRLLLRPLGDDDAPALLSIFSDPRVTRYMSNLPWDSLDRAHEMIAADRAAMAAGSHFRLGVERSEDSALVGMCTLFSFNWQCRRAEIGYGLAAHAWGHGYMDEALRALLDYGFGELGLNRIEADIDPRNVPSAKSLERLGFKREGLLRERWIVGDEVSDTAFYGLLRNEWEAGR